MKIIIYQNREVYKEESKIGNDSENKVETLEFEFPEEYADFTKYIEFQIKGEKYVDLIEDNKYVITREVAKYGKIKTQVVLKKNTENDVMIFKSDVFTLTVSNSINATENLVHTVGIDLIEKIVTKNNEQDARLDALEADNTNNKENISNLQNDNTTNKSDIKSLQDDNEVNKTDISNIKQEQTTQNINISNLQTDNTSNKSKIEALETKNTQQDTNIQKNTDDIAEINAKNTTQDEEIAQIKEKDTAQDSLIEQLQTKVVNLEAENTSLKNQIPSGEATGNPIHLTDSSDLECEIAVVGNSEQETRSGKNKLQLYFSDKTVSGVTITKNEDDSITLNGTATANINFLNLGKFLYELAKGTFKGCLTYKSGSMKDGSAGLFFSSSTTSGTNKGGTTLETKNKSFALSSTVTEDANIYPYIYINSGTTFDNFTFYFQVVNSDTDDFDYEQYGASPSPEFPSEIVTVGQNGSVEIKVDNGLETTDTNYQSYTKVLPTQKEFVKIGDYEDTFVKVDGKWYEKHTIGKGKYNPNNIGLNSSGNLRIKATLWGYDNKQDCNVLCKYFKNRYARWDDGNEINNVIYGWSSNGSIGINFDKNKFSTIEDFKNWASEVGLEFYFVKQQPELLECTEEQESILNSFYTYKGITNISVDGIATLKINYKKDLETIINNLSATSVAE